MFQPLGAALGLALLPVAWAASERARAERGVSASLRQEEDLSRYFPPGWQRETVPDWPAAVGSSSRGVLQRWRASRPALWLRRALRR